jgi:hypothetical protein
VPGRGLDRQCRERVKERFVAAAKSREVIAVGCLDVGEGVRDQVAPGGGQVKSARPRVRGVGDTLEQAAPLELSQTWLVIIESVPACSASLGGCGSWSSSHQSDASSRNCTWVSSYGASAARIRSC